MTPVLNQADAVYIGAQKASAVYAGATKVWPPAPKSYHGIVSADSPVGYWRLGDAAAAPAKDETATKNGTYQGVNTFAQPSLLPSGEGASVYFSTHNNSGVFVPDAAPQRIGGGDFTVECWVKPDSDTAAHMTWFFATGDIIGFQTDLNLQNYQYSMGGSQSSWGAMSSPIPTDAATHLAFAASGPDLYIYRNGALDTHATSMPHGATNASAGFSIGYYTPAAGYGYKGLMQEFALYNKVLTPAQIAKHYAAASPLIARVVQVGPGASPAVDTTGATLLVWWVSYNFTGGYSDSYGNTWTALTDLRNPPAGGTFLICANPTVGPNHKFTYSSGYPASCVAAFNTALTHLDTSGSSILGASGVIPAGSITPSSGNELLLTGVGHNSPVVPAIDSGFMLVSGSPQTPGVAMGGALAWKIQSSVAPVSPQWTATGIAGVGGVCAFK